jgi:hypothetical protein
VARLRRVDVLDQCTSGSLDLLTPYAGHSRDHARQGRNHERHAPAQRRSRPLQSHQGRFHEPDRRGSRLHRHPRALCLSDPSDDRQVVFPLTTLSDLVLDSPVFNLRLFYFNLLQFLYSSPVKLAALLKKMDKYVCTARATADSARRLVGMGQVKVKAADNPEIVHQRSWDEPVWDDADAE